MNQLNSRGASRVKRSKALRSLAARAGPRSSVASTRRSAAKALLMAK
jgi:hypothetical protein